MNKAILMGRLTREPELRYAQGSNLEICNFSLAVNRRYSKDREKSEADFINIVAFGKTAKFCQDYFRKGKQVAISGRIQTSSWDGQDGKRQYKTEVVAEDVYFADSKTAGESNNTSKPYSDAPNFNENNNSGSNGLSVDENDDDLPF
ncbi:MAG: single-stranded DNA-binding protein [Clostridiales bacterium]